ncbi:MAG TPA: hypothetical protein P5511_10260, partial [Candidatus Goldiibacteriota bacterium]|nr:hypothetical protein [Candidatus Goldiibacteriota bacterium]
VSTGQTITLAMSVTNTGDANGLNVSAETPAVSGAGNVTLVGSPAAIPLNGGASAVLVWTYTATAPGTVYFTSRAFGTDENSGVVRYSGQATSANVSIQSPARLSAAIAAVPSAVGVGQDITVILAVSNSGQAAANNVAPSGFANIGTVTGSMSGPSPAGADIAGAETAYFTWIYTPSIVGTARFEVSASGTDNNSGLAVSVPGNVTSNVVNVQPSWPVMTSWIRALPNALNQNQIFTLVMTVSNVGVVQATGTVPDDPEIIGAAVTGVSPVEPASANITAGNAADFTWIYRTTGATGNAVITCRARSLGEASDDISSGNTNTITVYADPVLSQQVFISAGPVSVGQRITIRMN